MIAAGEIYADLSAAAIAQPAAVAIFANAEMSSAFRRIDGSPHAVTGKVEIAIEPGAPVSWDGTEWRIVNVGDRNISLLGVNGALTELPRDTFDRLLSVESLKNAAAGSPQLSEATRILSGANEADLREANRRFDLVRKHINGERLSVPVRTIRFWTALYRAAQKKMAADISACFQGPACEATVRADFHKRLKRSPRSGLQRITKALGRDPGARHGPC